MLVVLSKFSRNLKSKKYNKDITLGNLNFQIIMTLKIWKYIIFFMNVSQFKINLLFKSFQSKSGKPHCCNFAEPRAECLEYQCIRNGKEIDGQINSSPKCLHNYLRGMSLSSIKNTNKTSNFKTYLCVPTAMFYMVWIL
jgi:hypothetical protein